MAIITKAFRSDVGRKLMDGGRYGNPMEVPRLAKIVVNMGIDASTDKDTMKALVEDLALVTGQRPVVTKARKSISNFKLREGMPVGAKVTLRGARMYQFMERLVHVALPRIRDFRGVPARSFDGRGSYTLGVREQTIFPEVNPDKIKKAQGMDVTFVTTAETDAEARSLLQLLGLPFEAPGTEQTGRNGLG